MIEDFKNDYMDGKVNSENYPESTKYLSAVLDTFSSMENSIDSGEDPVVVLSNIVKASEFVRDLCVAESNKDFDMMSKVLEKFSGVSVNMETARLEMKEYLKDKIDKM